MKPKLSFLCLLFSASAVTIVPVISQDTGKPIVKTEAQLLQERQHTCYVAIESQILDRLNPEISIASRYSRVRHPMPPQYYAAKISGENKEGIIEFQITHINRMIKEPTQVVLANGTVSRGTSALRLKDDARGEIVEPIQVVVAKGAFNSKTGVLLLRDDASGEYVVASEHSLLNMKLGLVLRGSR
jgi:hypothetical protein